MIEFIAVIAGYLIVAVGGLTAFLYALLWLLGKLIKQLGYWSVFVETLWQVAQKRADKRRRK